jgi:hypothetical protein
MSPSRSSANHDRAQGPVQPHTAIKVVEPGTPEHAAWVKVQADKQRAYEARFAVTSHLRPEHWGKG